MSCHPKGAAACATAAVLALGVPAASAAPERGDRVEKLVRSAAPDARTVRETYVRQYEPLPASAPAHPRRCDWIGYLRFRHRESPELAKRADAVLVVIPGFLGGASGFDQLARNVVRNAARRGKDVEFWALDRRSNCLEDHRGVRAAARARDPRVAYDYYWGDAEVNGRRFGGFKTSSEAAFLGTVGIERTLRDWYAVMRRGIPGRRRRARKLICGGHSLGGPLTAAFSSWDFDGDPETTEDAGYRQCAGLFGLDTTLELSGAPGPGGLDVALDLVGRSGAAPYISVPPLTPETIQVPAVFGVGAFHRPDGLSLLRGLPHSTNIDLSQRVLFSRDAAHFATGEPSIRDFRVTNEASLAGIFDDNSAPSPLTFIRSSVGSIEGGPLVDKNFPLPDSSLALPEQPNGPLYHWTSYRRVGTSGAPRALNDSGEPYTSRDSEVSDITQLARTMFEAPANFIEQYFPTRLVTDVAAAEAGAFDEVRYEGPQRRPALLVQAGDSNDNSAPDSGPAEKGTPPNDKPLSRELILPGYNHLDMQTAARRQNDGRPEETSRALTRFALKLIARRERR